MKRFVSIIIAIAMLSSLFSVSAASSSVHSGKFEGNPDISWKLDKNGTLTVTGNGDMPYECPWFEWKSFDYRDKVKKLVVGEGITFILCFCGMENLKTVSLPSTLKTIGSQCFMNDTALESITIPDSVTAITDAAFSGCTALKTIKLPANLEGVYMSCFGGCTSLRRITLPSKTEILGLNAFYNCTSLEFISLPASLKTVGWNCFTGCTSLTDVEYTGTKAKWKKIDIQELGNDALLNAKITCIGGTHPLSVNISNDAASGFPKLKWNKTDSVYQYEIFRSSSKTGELKRISVTSRTSFTDETAKPGYTYYYKVRSLSQSGKKLNESSVISRMCDCAVPVISAGNIASTGKVRLTWKPVNGAGKYEVYRSTSKNGTYTRVITTSKTSFVNTMAKTGVTYYYKVKAISDKNSSANSAFSATVKRTCDCPRPELTVSAIKGSAKIKLKWQAVEGAKSYEVYRCDTLSGTYKKLAATTKLSLTNTGLTAGKKYYYKIRAIGSTSTANSAYSTIKSCVCTGR